MSSSLRLQSLADLLMEPGCKPKKTPAQRKHTRSAISPWGRGGAKKKARTEQWRKSRYPIQYVLLDLFLTDHDLTMESLYFYLVQHFDSEALLEAHEGVWPEWDASSAVDRSANPVYVPA